MSSTGNRPPAPVYLVNPQGQYVTGPDGAPVVFDGEARTDSPTGFLTDAAGNFLLFEGAYVPVASAADFAGKTASQPDPGFFTPQDSRPAQAMSQMTTPSAPRPSAAQDKPTDEPTTETLPAVRTPDQPVFSPQPAPAYQPYGSAMPAQSYPQQQALYPQAQQPQPAGRSRWPLIALAAVLMAGLGAGAGWAFTQAKSSPSASDGAAAAQGTESEPENAAGSPSDSEVIRVPADAYPGAGESEIPSDSWPTGEPDGSFDWMAPSENIRCRADGRSNEMRCMIASWQKDAPEGTASGGSRPVDTVVLDADGTIRLEADGGQIGHVDATLLYGTNVYDAKRNWVCGATENGITCWSLKSGHGFVIRRAGMLRF